MLDLGVVVGHAVAVEQGWLHLGKACIDDIACRKFIASVVGVGVPLLGERLIGELEEDFVGCYVDALGGLAACYSSEVGLSDTLVLLTFAIEQLAR